MYLNQWCLIFTGIIRLTYILVYGTREYLRIARSISSHLGFRQWTDTRAETGGIC